MARLTADQWGNVRAEREAGASFRDLAAKYGVSLGTLGKRAKTEGWGDGADYAEEIRRKANAKANGIANGVDSKTRADAINTAADEAAGIVRKHREEWTEHQRLFPTASIAADFELGKSAKISAEVLTIRQAGQRRAWNLDDGAPTVAPVSRPLVTL